jgi:hypothetical protein
VLALPLAASAPPAAAPEGNGYPQSGYLSSLQLAAHAAPSSTAPVLEVLHQFRSDELPTVVLVVSARSVSGVVWDRVSLPGRPNGRYGWVKASHLDGLVARERQITVDRGARTLTVSERGHVLFRTRVAVGRPGMETPIGHFYLMAGFKPQESVLGPWAFETSAYSKLSDWPGGGIIGIHGWNDPSVLGHAVSHGCVRVSDQAILHLKTLVSAGTPVEIVN